MPVEFECPHCQALIEQTQEEPRAAADRLHAMRQASSRTQWAEQAERQGPAARRPWSASGSSWPATSATSCGTPSRFALMNLEGYDAGAGRPTPS